MAGNKERNAADAYNNVNTTIKATKANNVTGQADTGKKYKVDYGSATNDTTTENIKEKEARMIEILGSSNLNSSQTIKRVQSLANSTNENDINLYHELMRLATDIDEYYNNQHNGVVNFFQRLGNAMSSGGTKSGEQIADRLVQAQKTLPGGFIYGVGTDNLQRSLQKNYSDFKSSILPNINSLTPKLMVDTLHKLQDYYKREYAILKNIPNTTQNANAIASSTARLNEYSSAWKQCERVINEIFAHDAMSIITFLEAYLNNPPSALDLPEGLTREMLLGNIEQVKPILELRGSKESIADYMQKSGGVQ